MYYFFPKNNYSLLFFLVIIGHVSVSFQLFECYTMRVALLGALTDEIGFSYYFVRSLAAFTAYDGYFQVSWVLSVSCSLHLIFRDINKVSAGSNTTLFGDRSCKIGMPGKVQVMA